MNGQKISPAADKAAGELFERRSCSYAELVLGDAMLDAENWKIVFKVYARHPISALTLAYQLIAIKQSLQRGPKGIADAIAGLDLAIESLYPHTDFYRMGQKFYHRTIEGTLKPDQEDRLRQLGVKLTNP